MMTLSSHRITDAPDVLSAVAALLAARYRLSLYETKLDRVACCGQLTCTRHNQRC